LTEISVPPPGDAATKQEIKSGKIMRPWMMHPRQTWANLAHSTALSLDDQTIASLRGINDPTDRVDVAEIYLPLTQFINLYREELGNLSERTNSFLGTDVVRTPFVIGIAGSVAVGKSTVARLLTELLRQLPDRPKVDLITTDGFLYPNAELERRGILERKGFPESYDRASLLQFVIDVKSGKPKVTAPIYSHVIYDIVPEEVQEVCAPDILIIEGLNVLQPAAVSHHGQSLTISEFFDFSIYVDAHEEHIRQWFINRFLVFRESAFRDPNSFFRAFADMGDTEAIATANQVWDDINGRNLRENIEPTRERATLILHKGEDHLVKQIWVRKI